MPTPIPHLFSPLPLRGVTLPNRIVVSPMCMYSSQDGLASDWHLVHLGSHAVGGAGLVFVEATAICPEGRISPKDMGIWSDAHVEPLARVVRFLHSQGSCAAIQLAHAGRKASTWAPGEGDGRIAEDQGGWMTVASSPIPFSDRYPRPVAIDSVGIAKVRDDFVAATERALNANFDVVEIHAAHGYLLHQFLSPLSNQRTDEYGGSFENRTRLVREVVTAVRAVWPAHLPLFVRLSATDWADGGWNADETVALARLLREAGVDLVDVSSGGLVPNAEIPLGPGYQAPFAARVRRETGIPSSVVGLVTAPAQADQLVRNGQADLVMLAREMLRDPHWPLRAAREFGAGDDLAAPVSARSAARNAPASAAQSAGIS